MKKKIDYFKRQTLLLSLCYLISAIVVFLLFFIETVLNFEILNYSNLTFFVGFAVIASGCTVCVTLLVEGKRRTKFFESVEKVLSNAVEGDFSERVIFTDDELLDEIGSKLNALIAELESSEVLKNDFLQRFSQEFIKPVEELKSYAESLKTDELDEIGKLNACRAIHSASCALIEKANKTIILAKLKSQNVIESEVVRFNEKIEKFALERYSAIEKKGLKAEIDASPIRIYASNELVDVFLDSVYAYLIDGAIDGGEVCVKGENFKRGYLFYAERLERDGSVGLLDLDIARKVSESSGWKFEVETKQNLTRFKVFIPKEKLYNLRNENEN